MEWMLLAADVILVGFLVHLWSGYQVRANDLKRRRQAALDHAAEYRQQIETLQKEAAAVEAKLPEIEAQASTLKEEVARAENRLARAEASTSG